MEIMIFSKDNCAYCKAAIQLAESRGHEPTVQKLDEHYTVEQFRERFPTAKSFPQIEVNGFHVGGFKELSNYLNNMD